jgi:hypothetical protein
VAFLLAHQDALNLLAEGQAIALEPTWNHHGEITPADVRIFHPRKAEHDLLRPP